MFYKLSILTSIFLLYILFYLNVLTFKSVKGLFIHIILPGVSVISRFEKRSSDITSGRVHLDVCWIDQSTSLPSANVAHLSATHLDGHAHL